LRRVTECNHSVHANTSAPPCDGPALFIHAYVFFRGARRRSLRRRTEPAALHPQTGADQDHGGAPAQAAIDAYVDGYNTRRPHQALDGGTPAERFTATTPAAQTARHNIAQALPLVADDDLARDPRDAPRRRAGPATRSQPAGPARRDEFS
jgi:hypothetical protein